MKTSTRWVLATVWLAAAGCGGSEIDSSYAGLHRSEIELDCTKTVMCRAQQGMTLEVDPIPRCVERTGNILNNERTDEEREMYERRVANCSHLLPCDYSFCTLQTVSSFAESHMSEIEHDCNALVACEQEMGIMSGQDPYNNCVEAERRRLDMLDESAKTGYETRFGMCATLAGCSFTQCFRAVAP